MLFLGANENAFLIADVLINEKVLVFQCNKLPIQTRDQARIHPERRMKVGVLSSPASGQPQAGCRCSALRGQGRAAALRPSLGSRPLRWNLETVRFRSAAVLLSGPTARTGLECVA